MLQATKHNIVKEVKEQYNMSYIIAICCLVAFYIITIRNMNHLTKPKIVNALVSLSIFAIYIYVVYHAYESVGFDDWNFQNTLPVANVSPFMFSTMPLSWVLPKKAKKHYFLLITLLSLGMLFSSIFSCAFNAIRNYKFHWSFFADYLAHILLSLWGVYLVKSKQVELKKRDCIIAGSLIVSVALIMLVLNIIFDTAFFGLSLNGKHSIYNVVIVENSVISALIYLSGLVFILALGYLYNKMLNKKIK